MSLRTIHVSSGLLLPVPSYLVAVRIPCECEMFLWTGHLYLAAGKPAKVC